jgi:hypothetical protein
MNGVHNSRLVGDYYGLTAVMLGGRVYPIGYFLPNLQAIGAWGVWANGWLSHSTTKLY